MDLSPARMAEMLAHLAQAHNDQERAQGVAHPTTLTGWDLAKLWMVADSCNSVADFNTRADVSVHVRKVGLPLLVSAGWLERRADGRARVFEPRIPEAVLEERRSGNATALIFSDLGARAAARLQRGAPSPDREGMNPPSISVNVTVHIEFTGQPEGVRQRTTIGPDRAPAHDQPAPHRAPAHSEAPDTARRRTVNAEHGAPAHDDGAGHGAPAHDEEAHTVRQRTPSSVDRAPAHPNRAPEALSKGSQSSLSSIPSEKTDRSIDRDAQGGDEQNGWTCPAETSALPALLHRETKMPFSDGALPDLASLFRQYGPGRVFATFLSLCEESGGCNQGGLNQAVRSERSAAWSHTETRDALARIGVRDHKVATRLAWNLCPLTVAAIAEIRDECNRKAAAGKGRRVDNMTGWVPIVVESGTPYDRAHAAAVQRFKGRKAERDAIARRQEAAAQAKAKAKSDALEAKRTAESHEARVRAADAQQLRDAVALVMDPKRTCGSREARSQIQALLTRKTPVRDIARMPKLGRYIVAAMDILAKEARRG